MKRYFILLLAALAAVVCLCGCGSDSDAEQELAAEQMGTPDIFIEDSQQLPRSSTPPNLVIETSSGEVVSATYATLGGYVWEWMDEDGSIEITEDEAPCAAEMKEIATIFRSASSGSARLQISGGELRSVRIWADGAKMDEGQKLAVEGNVIVFPESGAYRYEVVVEYDGGRVYYAFMITD